MQTLSYSNNRKQSSAGASSHASSDADIVIVGGGLMGLMAACALQSRYTITLIDPTVDLTQHQSLTDFTAALDTQKTARTVALNRASIELIIQLRLWPALEPFVLPYRGIWVQDTAHQQTLDFDGQQLGQYPLGGMIENNALINALKAAIDVTRCNIVNAPIRASEQHSADIANGKLMVANQSYQADLIIAADGAQSVVRNAMDITTAQHDYHQHGVVLTVKHSKSNQAMLRQWFMGKDILAFLPVTLEHASLVWSTPDPDAILRLSKTARQQVLSDYSQGVVGDIIESTTPVSFPLKYLRANAFASNRVVLLGDAAHQVHPMAGLGANLGFADLASLVAQIDRRIHPIALRRYQRERQWQSKLAQHGIDGLFQLYQSQHPLITPLRSTGMQLLGRITPIKRQIAKFATGNKS